MGKRTYAQREWRLLSWWLATYHANADEILMNVRVGPTVIPTIAGAPAAVPSTARLGNRWADAIFFEHGETTIVEAKMEPDPGIFSQLHHYARLFRMDPTFAEHAERPLRLVAVVYHDDKSVGMEAPWYGVKWVVYQPVMNDFVPPQLKGTFADSIGSMLPQDWPARVNLLTGRKLALGG